MSKFEVLFLFPGTPSETMKLIGDIVHMAELLQIIPGSGGGGSW